MKIGVSTFAWSASFDPSQIDILSAIREHGLDGCEIPIFDPAAIAASKLRKAFQANQLDCTVCALLPSAINPISPDGAIRKKALAHLKACVEVSAELGARVMGGPVFAPIGYLPGRRRNQDEWNWALECFQSLGSLLDANEVTLALEPVNRGETFFLTTAEEAKTFCDAISHPRVGVLIDTFHANIEEKSIPNAILSLGARVKHIHASENDRGIPGSGHVDFAGVITALRQINYEGYLMIEGFGFRPPEVNPPVVIWRGLEASPEEVAFGGATFLRNLL